MLKHYTLTFTEDRQNFRTMVVPAHSLAEAYIEIQKQFPGAEITDYSENNKVTEKWAQPIARYMIANATVDEICVFASYLDDDKREELASAIWDEYHNNTKKAV